MKQYALRFEMDRGAYIGSRMSDVGDLFSKGIRINGTDSLRGGEIVVKAQVPLSELEGYAAELKSVTAGRGRYSLDFSHYESVPAQVQARLVEGYKPRHEED
jgi:elongation factor G